MGSAADNDAFLLSFSTIGQRPALAGSHAAVFCRVLARLHRRLDFRLYAFVVLPDRARLIVATSDGTPDSAERLAQRLRSRLGRELEWRTRWPGPVLRDAAGVVPVGGGRTLLRRVDFLHRLPVLMGLVGEPSEWRWSSYRGWRGLGRPPVPVDRPPLPTGVQSPARAFSG
ncbi:MAG TPA: hypothetical protein VFC25_09035 [Verrucomicrobiae bacterium]|nr:hypothetical protein [Verrucomicrobiae bacterium]